MDSHMEHPPAEVEGSRVGMMMDMMPMYFMTELPINVVFKRCACI
jgi:hypothetical protein